MNEFIHHVNDSTFEPEVLKSDVPVLVDFWAEWCGPCKMIAPTVDELARQYKGKVKVAKMDVDKHQQVPQQFGIRSIPTLLVFKGGRVVDTIIWAGALVAALATFVFPFLALYLTARGLGPQEVGLVVSCLGLGTLAAGPVG